MMKYILLLLIPLFLGQLLMAQTWEGDYLIETQEQVDNFTEDCGCDIINGNLTIGNGEDYFYIDNLLGLSNLTTVTGHFHMGKCDLVDNMEGLNNLTTVGGGFSLIDNYQLVNLDGLNSLTTVGSLTIQNHLNLQNIDDLEALTTIEQDLIIRDNIYLESLDGLSNVTEIGRDVFFINNDGVSSLDGFSEITELRDVVIERNNGLLSMDAFSDLTEVRDFRLYKNKALLTINGLSNLEIVNRELEIAINYSLEISPLVGITYIGGDISLISIYNVSSLEVFSQIEEIHGNFNLSSMFGLESLSALSNLKSIAGFFQLYGTYSLSNLNGLENLTSIGDGLFIRYNTSLMDIEALYNIASIGGEVKILQNYDLIHCCVIKCWTENDVTSVPMNINYNHPDCNYYESISANCSSNECVVSNAPISDYSMQYYPNPVKNRIHFSADEQEYIVKLFSLDGHLIEVSTTKKIVDVSDLESGIYLLSIYQDGVLLMTEKVMKM